MADLERLARAIIEFYEKLSSWEHCVVKGKGLTLPQTHAVEILGANPSLRMKGLAEKMGVTTGTLTVLVDRLEAKGMVRRRPHGQDRRAILVELTDKGRQCSEEHHRLHLDLTREISSGLTPEQTGALAQMLEDLAEKF